MRNCIFFACFALALPCAAFAQKPAAPEKTPASAASKNVDAAQSKLAQLLEGKVRAAWDGFREKRQKCIRRIFSR